MDKTNFLFTFTSVHEMEKKKYDMLIIGTGAGGGASIWRLCQKWKNRNKQIGVIEAGDIILPAHVKDVKNGREKKHFQNIAKPYGEGFLQFSGSRQLFALGGRTLFWSTVSPRFHNSEFTNWPISIKEMDTYYQIAEKKLHVTRDAFMSTDSHLTLQNLGIDEVRNTPRAVLNVQKNFFKHYSSLILLNEAYLQKKFDIAINSRVVKVLIDDNQTIGVQVMTVDDKTVVIRSKNIILATGALETPRILLQSCINGNAIGRYLTNHSSVAAQIRCNHKAAKPFQTRLLIPQTTTRPYQLQLFISNRFISITGFGKVEPRIENRVYIDPQHTDEWGISKIKVDFSYSPQDYNIINQMKKTIEEIVSALDKSISKEESAFSISLKPPGDDYHESSTCRMGLNPSTSVTNPFGKVYGISGLYIADNSILPSTGAANPVLTTVALAMRNVDHFVNIYEKNKR
ncbi:GMC oxidoreductase [Alkalihalobacterium elongatum]|uniref:GMC oxidoreductase n=1 Tax=Alkalihalobacterium elongatum TaxID=2675466 RepID=UPI001C1F8EF1|nr:GMC oxidoreductase [Alkalihalobacterium elongatum]